MGVLKPSTRKFVQEARKNSIPWYEILHGYIYGRWTYFYIAMGTGRHPLAKYFAPLANWLGRLLEQKIREEPGKYVSLADTYHGKAIPLETARQLVLVNEPIRLLDLEKVIPYKRARALILDNPGHIVALDCPCRSAKPNPCQPIDVCLIVGEPFASFVIEHNPNKARWISPGEAEEILQAENARGHVQHAFFKDAMLGRFYAICNCCSCCCGAIEAHQHGTPMLASSGFVAQVNEDLCTGCGNCETACPFGAVSLPEGTSLIDQQKCMGCGVCVEHCTVDAISLRRDPAKGEPLEIPGL
jgi:ferredoxin